MKKYIVGFAFLNIARDGKPIELIMSSGSDLSSVVKELVSGVPNVYLMVESVVHVLVDGVFSRRESLKVKEMIRTSLVAKTK